MLESNATTSKSTRDKSG